ncbi:MAG: ABC transporter permease [Candidatus Aminicenantes bacterium]|jgi:putative ABC transport system permease protein
MMLKNYFKSALRNMARRKGYSLINITGLAIGMACCLLILMFVNDELNCDNYNENADRIYRINGSYRYGGRDFQFGTVSAPMAAALIDEFPEVEDAVRFRNKGSYIIKFEDKSFTERRVIFSDTTIFNVFTIPLRQGDPKTALREPYTIVLSKKTAGKYFGTENPLGKILKLDNDKDYKVTGVFTDIPHNSHFHFDIIASLASLEESRSPSWLQDNFFTYILLKPGASPKALEAKFPGLIKKYFAPEIEKFLGQSMETLITKGDVRVEFYLQPLLRIHLYSDLMSELEPNSDIRYVYIFSAIALFILAIASINFMNLSTARSASRAKEVGLRKVLGSVRRQLIGQFLVESLVMSIAAMVIALMLVNLALPYFNSLSGKELTTADNYNGVMVLSMLVITLLTGLLAGFYPAFFISAFHPISVLKGRLKSGVKSGSLRSILVVFQFTVSIILIIGTLVVMNQLNYIQNKKLGFDKDRVLILHYAYLLDQQAQTFKNEMLKYPQIKNAAVSSFLPVPSSRWGGAVSPEGKWDTETSTSVQHWTVDYDYISTLGMKLAAGRNFSKSNPTDTSAVIINQAAAKQFGWEKSLGKRLDRFFGEGETESYTVIGVVEDFHFESLRNTIAPVLLYLGHTGNLISFRINTENIARTIDLLRDKWEQFLPGQPFEYSFMDERFDQVYQTEQRLGKIFGTFALLAIFVGCLGLFGLAAFISEQRTKEIGIRKVLGASIPSIIRLLSLEFVRLVGTATLIAWPLAYFIMNQWLREFAYKTSLSIWIFLAAGISAVTIALLTVGYQSVKTALTDPVKSIQYE